MTSCVFFSCWTHLFVMLSDNIWTWNLPTASTDCIINSWKEIRNLYRVPLQLSTAAAASCIWKTKREKPNNNQAIVIVRDAFGTWPGQTKPTCVFAWICKRKRRPPVASSNAVLLRSCWIRFLFLLESGSSWRSKRRKMGKLALRIQRPCRMWANKGVKTLFFWSYPRSFM